MAPLFEVAHLFSAPGAYLAEIRQLGRTPQAPGTKAHQWLWIQESSVMLLSLRIVAEDRNRIDRRGDEQAQLHFDEHRGTLRWSDGEVVALTALAFDKLPAPLVQLVNHHLT